MKKYLIILSLVFGTNVMAQEFYYLNYGTQTTTVTNNVTITNVNTVTLPSLNNNGLLNNVLLDEPVFMELDFNSDVLLFSRNVDLFLENDSVVFPMPKIKEVTKDLTLEPKKKEDE